MKYNFLYSQQESYSFLYMYDLAENKFYYIGDSDKPCIEDISERFLYKSLDSLFDSEVIIFESNLKLRIVNEDDFGFIKIKEEDVIDCVTYQTGQLLKAFMESQDKEKFIEGQPRFKYKKDINVEEEVFNNFCKMFEQNFVAKSLLNSTMSYS